MENSESLKERIQNFKHVQKSPKRGFMKRETSDLTLYSLPNGISVVEVETDLAEGKKYKGTTLNVGFDFEVIENRDSLLIIKALGYKRTKIDNET